MLLEQVAKLPLCARVYACRFDGPKRKERARGRALAWMVAELEYGVRHVVLDRREEHQDACDRRLMIGLAGRPPRFAAMHRSSAEEPLLWVADIVVSAVAGDLAYGGDKQIERIKDVLEAVNCEP
ncbi:hypothetical protein [Streptosporangium sandarakinum]|uniref:hypothetical protein n=1 Tax=Streptosporangium sandarakinum TaxID=1260955 RepID=UPI0033B0656B